MKKLILLFTISLIFSCNKENHFELKETTIDSMCWDGTNYIVNATIGSLKAGDNLKAVFIFGKDTLFKTILMPRNGSHTFILGTGEVGCNGLISIIKNDIYSYSVKANCESCLK